MTAEVRYDIMVNGFVSRYVNNKIEAAQWAIKNIPKELYPTLKPLIRDALRKKGYSFRDETNS